MERVALAGTDLSVSRLCYGGAGFGTAVRGADLDALIDAFRDAGGNFFDTAHIYAYWAPGGDGASERALADYFRRRGGRAEAVIATKGGHPGRPGYRTVDGYLSRGRLQADIDDSLGRLDTDTIELYWLHRDDTRLEVAEILGTLNDEIKRGRIRHLAPPTGAAPAWSRPTATRPTTAWPASSPASRSGAWPAGTSRRATTARWCTSARPTPPGTARRT